MQELESLFETPLFDRSSRAARLTEKGEEMFAVAKRLLGLRFTGILNTSNMLALIGMTVSGLGLTYLPLRCLQPSVR